MKMNKFVMTVAISTLLGLGTTSFADETLTEKAETVTNKSVDSVKKGYRKTKDKTCEMLNGKMQCLGKKIKNDALNISDEVKTKATEIKNKTD